MTDHVCPPDHKHGETSTCYLNHRCRCTDCTTGRNEYQYWRRHVRAAGRTDLLETLVDARGVRRRLEALAAIGWSAERIGARLGVTNHQILHWRRADRVTFTTHERVAALYETLSDHPAPTDTRGNRISAHRAMAQARRHQWARPIDWDDIDLDRFLPVTVALEPIIDVVAVELAVNGTTVALSTAERHIAVQALNARGYNDQEISQLLGVADKTIGRDRELLGLPANRGPADERFAA